MNILINLIVFCLLSGINYSWAISQTISSTKINQIQDQHDNKENHNKETFKYLDQKVHKLLPNCTIFETVTFSWLNPIIKRIRNSSIQLEDLWQINRKYELSQTVIIFHDILEKEKHMYQLNFNSSFQIMQNSEDIWKSPLIRTIIKMFYKQFLVSGMYKFTKSCLQFAPAILISKIVKLSESRTKLNHKNIIRKGLIYSSILFLILILKTVFNNQYFHKAFTFSSDVKLILCAEIFNKSLYLSPMSKKYYTVYFSIFYKL